MNHPDIEKMQLFLCETEKGDNPSRGRGMDPVGNTADPLGTSEDAEVPEEEAEVHSLYLDKPLLSLDTIRLYICNILLKSGLEPTFSQ